MNNSGKAKWQSTPSFEITGFISKIIVLLAAVFFLLPAVGAQAQTGSLSGRVSDSAGRVLQGARVELQPGGTAVVTDNQGEFRIINVPPGNYKLTVSFVGFAAGTQDVVVAASQAARADMTMQVANANDQVIVTAERPHGEAEAINRELTAPNILQVLPHDVIVSLPNANVADAIGRLPSVTLERDEGEGKYVQIRGTEPRFSNVTVDGVNVPSPEGVRQIKLDIVPSDLVESVEINKTLLANQDGDAIGGSVNLRTKTAGERPTIEGFGQGGYTPIANGRGEDQFGLTIGRRFGPQHKLGIIGGFTYDYNGRGIDDIEPVPQALQCVSSTDCTSPTGDNSPYFATYNGTDLREYNYYRSRYGFGGSADYKISDTASVYAHLLYSHFNNFGDRWVYSPTINSFISPFQGGPDGNSSFNASVRRPVQVIGSLALGGDKFFRNSYINYEVAVARASSEDQGYSQSNFNPIDGSPLNAVTFGVDLSNPNRPRFPVQNNVNIFDPTQYNLTDLDNNHTYGPQLNLQGGASYTQNYTLGGHLGVWEIGGKFRNVHKFNEANDVYYTATNPNLLLSQFLGGFRPDNYYEKSYQYGPTADYNKIRRYFRNNPGDFEVNVSKTHQRNDPQSYNLDERVSAGYVQNALNFGRFRLYTGLRIEGTNEYVKGYVVQSDAKNNYISTTPSTTNSSYVDPLGTAQLQYTWPTGASLRFAYGRGISRPDYQDLPPYLNISDRRNSISAGNPNLKATHANSYDLLYEREIKPLGIFQAGIFYKDITDPIYFVQTTLQSGTFAGFQQTQPVNGSSAWVWGFELAYQQRFGFLPGAFSGAGLSANYSYTNSEAKGVPGRTDNPSLQRQAPNTWNISPTYDRGRLSLRVGIAYNQANIFQYNYSDGAPLGKKGPNGDVYLYTHLQTDAQGSFRLARGFSVYAYGLNLNNEVFGFYQGSGIYPIQREYYKPTYAGGIRWTQSVER